MINQIATYSKVNNCFISWRCFIVIYLQIHRQPIKYRNIGAFVYDWTENQILNAMSLAIEQRKNEFDRIAKVRFTLIYFYTSLSGHLPGSIFSREGDIASTKNLLISFKPIICKLKYTHVIITSTCLCICIFYINKSKLVWFMVFNAPFNNISVISWRSVL